MTTQSLPNQMKNIGLRLFVGALCLLIVALAMLALIAIANILSYLAVTFVTAYSDLTRSQIGHVGEIVAYLTIIAGGVGLCFLGIFTFHYTFANLGEMRAWRYIAIVVVAELALIGIDLLLLPARLIA